MSKRFEKSLSLILVILIMIELIITGYINIAGGEKVSILAEVWNICFILSWIFMLIYSIYILFQSSSKGYSIFVAIVTAISFIFLTYHGLIMGSKYFDFMPKTLAVTNEFLLINAQIIFYTALFAVYILHLINVLKINKNKEEDENGDDDKKNTLEVEENTSDGVFLVDNDKN